MSFRLSRVVEELVWEDDLGAMIAVPGGLKIDHWGSRYELIERDGVFELGRYERTDPPVVDWRATDRVTIERQLLILVGANLRQEREMPLIGLPYRHADIRPGYAVVTGSQKGWSTLRRRDGSLVPFEARDVMGDPVDAVTYSFVADMPLEDLAASYRDPHGFPLFSRYLYTDVSRW